MKRSLLIFFLLITFVITGAFAQNEKTSDVRSNWISGELSLVGGGVRYERMLNSSLSIGANAYYSYTFIIIQDIGVDVFARWYPWGKTFYTGLAVGFHQVSVADLFDESDVFAITGAAVTPEIGWKVDVGNPGEFFIQPGIKVPITIGVSSVTNNIQVYTFPIIYFGMGYSF